eukprot:GEMP01036573.1.p1 GENE.GEMP01036573.1~~GEMP01036573.1.p1  ORF type:complete len:423 (+),score=25.14 GEMP01036573.1:153-1421(+)
MNGIAAKRFSVLRSWDEIGIHDVDALTQKHVTKTEQLFYDSDFNFSIPVVKRGQFARQIGMKVLKQRYERLANIANVEIKAAQLHWHASYFLQNAASGTRALTNGGATRAFSVLRSWSDIGIDDFGALMQKHVTKAEGVFDNSDFDLSMSTVKRGQFAREIGKKVLEQYEGLSNVANVQIKAAKLSWHPSSSVFCLNWSKICDYKTHPVLLVGFFPGDVRVWKWDKRMANLCDSGHIFVSGKAREEDFEAFDPNPGELLARIPYSCKSSWRLLGFNDDFKTTLSQYQTKGGRVYDTSPLNTMEAIGKYRFVCDISDLIVAFSPLAEALKNSRTITRTARASLLGKDLCQFRFGTVILHQVDNVMLIPYYPNRLEAFLCPKKDVVDLVTSSNNLFFYSSLGGNGRPQRIEPPGHLLASLPFPA